MMEEMVQKLSQRTGLAPDKAQEAVDVIISMLKEKLPEPMAKGLDSLLAGGSAGGSFLDEAKLMASGLGSMFGNKA